MRDFNDLVNLGPCSSINITLWRKRMKAYGNKKTVPSRMARKRLRQDVFMKNKKATKLRKKLQRESRRDLEGAE